MGPGRLGGRTVPIAFVVCAAVSLGGCLTLPAESSPGPAPQTTVTPEARTEPSMSLTERQVRILDAADELLATQNFVISGYRYAYDCTGTILAIYAMAGIPLVDLFPDYSGNGVTRLYGIAGDRDLLYHSDFPLPGDLIFWDNTYDKNGDRQWNDGLTHVGLVLSSEPDGTIEYLHHDYTKGVVRARMNLTDPDTHMGENGIIVNSPMRMRRDRPLNPDEWLASHLYRRLGALHRIDL